ncbi:tail fiber assembly protein [Serratia symbiotica]|uniref:Tail assembly chaperone n=1 Tax=Serratia symbiotica TaxID=138074 RepID=A0A7D5T6T8_9GAMM|nr:tail assembly chaperone [Serratia symbiotica]MBF1994484.1 tail assembly chaperone [Serratia symbiotica]QLH62037.1 tail assembly chaperone [Serratia symbiotica]QTP15184.1 tail assembly chaperone [Serratia symbiotica]
MKKKTYKNFTININLTDTQKEEAEQFNVQFLISDNGEDWYETAKTFEENTVKISYDSNGVIRSISEDASMLFPLNCSVSEFSPSDIPEGINITGGWLIKNGIISEILQNSMSIAKTQRNSLRAKAEAEIAWRQDAVNRKKATSEEAGELVEWLDYRLALMRLDLSRFPELSWPAEPALKGDDKTK